MDFEHLSLLEMRNYLKTISKLSQTISSNLNSQVISRTNYFNPGALCAAGVFKDGGKRVLFMFRTLELVSFKI